MLKYFTKKRLFTMLLLCAFMNYMSLFAYVSASEITKYDALPTDTTIDRRIEQNNAIFDIKTSTAVKNGTIGINTFSKFNVSQGDTVNLNLIDQQNKLVNLVFDSSASQIDGIVNSYVNGQIGGNVLFANPNGFVIGQNGVFNVGSLTLMTPTMDAMKDLFKDAVPVEDNINSLISFSLGGNDYLINGNAENPIVLAPSKIQIDGTINSGKGIDVISGMQIDINSNAKLNANMGFIKENGKIKAVQQNLTIIPNNKTFAMQDGNNIIIVSSNSDKNSGITGTLFSNPDPDKLSGIVNLDGRVNANNGNVVIKTETFNPSDGQHSQSVITVNGNADISGKNVDLKANTKLERMARVDVADEPIPVVDQLMSTITSVVTPVTKVIINDGANLEASNDMNIMAVTDMNLSSSEYGPALSVNYTKVDSDTEVLIKSGSKLSAKNLEADAFTNLNLKITNKVVAALNNALSHLTGGSDNLANIGVTVTNNTIKNKAIIEKDVDLSGVTDNLKLIATTRSYVNSNTQNGAVPIVDRNRTGAGIVVDVKTTDIVNEARLYSDVNVTGDLEVKSYYKGNIISNVDTNYVGGGNDAMGWKLQKLASNLRLSSKVPIGDWLLDTTNNTDSAIAGAVNVNVANVKSIAEIGHLNSGADDEIATVKPSITAGTVTIKSDLIDDKSNISAIASAEGTQAAKGAAVAVNVKNNVSDASGYADFTVTNSKYNILYFDRATSKVDNRKENDFYKLNYSYTVITAEEYAELSDEDKTLYEVVSTDTPVYAYDYFSEDGVKYNTSDKYEITFKKEGDKYVYKENKDALSITSNTTVLHPLSWGDMLFDFLYKFRDFFLLDGERPISEVKENWQDIGSNNVSDYLDASEGDKDVGFLDILMSDAIMVGLADVSNFGLRRLFNTYAQNAIAARVEEGELANSSAYSGAFAVQVFDSTSNATLVSGSTVTSNITNSELANISVKANTTNELWTLSALLNPLEVLLNKGVGGVGSDEGDAGALATTVSYSDSATNAIIGENVTIKNNSNINNSLVGIVNVEANSDGNSVSGSAGHVTAGEGGLSGDITFNYVTGNTTAGIETSNSDSSISATNVYVDAIKDVTYVNPNVVLTMANNAKGGAGTGILLMDTVDAYIKGNVSATNDVRVSAKYDKLTINAIFNAAVAKSISMPGSDIPEPPGDDVAEEPGTVKKFFLKIKDFFWAGKDYDKIGKKTPENMKVDPNYSTPDVEKSSAMAGGLSFTATNNDVTATISDNAIVKAGNKVRVNAESIDEIYDVGLILSANGKSGVGATILADVITNNVTANINNATVDALKLVVNSNEDMKLAQASAGITHGKDTAGVGNLSSVVIVNDTSSYIINNSQINQNKNNKTTEQEVEVTANSKNREYKLAGAVGIQAGEGGADSKAIGATLDGDVNNSSIKAYIDNSTVDASNKLTVKADVDNVFIPVDVAGAVSTQGKAIAGVASAYIDVNTIEAYINKSTINVGDLDLTAQSYFEEIVVNGTVAAGNQTGAGATIRADVICNDVNSYIKDSTVKATGDVKLTNSETIEQISVAVAGAGSTTASAGAGVISTLVDITEQNNYIENSTVNSNSLNLDSDKTIRNIAVTGAIAAAVNPAGVSVGASTYALGVAHDVNTYIKNSDINTTNDIILTSDYYQDSLSIIFGGAGGEGIAASGAVNTLVNNSNIKTYISNDKTSTKKNLHSTKGKIELKTNTDIDTITIDGNVSISNGGTVAAGGAVNTTVYDSDIEAGIDNADVIAKQGINVKAKADQNHISTIIGASGSTGLALEGSVDTLVMSQCIDSYIKNSAVKSDGDISVISKDILSLVSVAGAAAASNGGASFGASVLTVTMTGHVKSVIDNVDIDKFNSELGQLLVKATQSDDFRGATISGSVGATGVAGTVDTFVIDKDILANVKDLQLQNDSEFTNVKVLSKGKTYLGHGTGQVSVGYSGAGVGGAVSTLVLNKNIDSKIEDSTVKSKGYLKNVSKADIDILSVVLGFGGASAVAVQGAVATQVLNVDTKSLISNSVVSAVNELLNKSKNKTDLDMHLTTANGAGTAAVGGVVYSLVDNSTAKAIINSNSNITKAGTLNNTSKMDSNYLVTTFNASGAGTAAVNGTVTTFVLNSEAKSLLKNSTFDNVADVNVKSNNTAKSKVIMSQASGAGTAAVNGGVNTFVSTKKSKAKIENSTINSTGNVKVLADANNTINTTVAGGAGAGTAAITGSVNTIVSNDDIKAKISDSAVTTSVANNLGESAEDNGIIVKTNDTLSVVGHTGSGAGSGTAAVGGAIITGVINNTVKSVVKNSDLTATNADVIIKAVTNETVGSSKNPFITIAATGSGMAAVSGAIDTLVFNTETTSKINGKKVYGIYAGDKIALNSDGTTNLYVATGSGAGSGMGSVGATVSTIVIDKKIKAIAKDTYLGTSLLDIDAKAVDKFDNVIVAGSGAGVAGVAGAVNTKVIESTLNAGVKNSKINANNIDIQSKAEANLMDVTGEVAGGGAVGVGASVATNVIGYTSNAFVKNSSVKNKLNYTKADKINIDSNVKSTYNLYTASGAAGGVAGVGGVVSTNVVNNEINAYATGNSEGLNVKNLSVNSKDDVTFKGVAGSLSVGGVGIGATIQTNSVTSTISSYIGGKILAEEADVKAEGIQDYDTLVAAGFGGGTVAIEGSSLANITEATVKSYVLDNSNITVADKIDVNAKNTTKIDEVIGTAATSVFGSVGASVGVNKINNTVEAFTGNNVTLTAKDANFDAQSFNLLGQDEGICVIAGSGAGVAGVAGSVLVNDIEDSVKAYIGTGNEISTTNSLNLIAKDTTKIKEEVGGYGAGSLLGVGASVGVNVIDNTAITSVGSGSVLDMATGNLKLDALTTETINANARVVGGGALALSGGILYNTIGKNVDNATENALSAEDAATYNQAKQQADSVLAESTNYKNDANNEFIKDYNKASSDSTKAINDANTNIANSLRDGLNKTIPNSDTKASVNTDNVIAKANAGVNAATIEEKSSVFSLFTKSDNSGSSYGSTDRSHTTSAFVDTAARILANDVKIKANDISNVILNADGYTLGLGSVGIAAAVSNVYTTVNAFVSNNAVIESNENIEINANSSDTQEIDVFTALGGIVGGSGGVATANSNRKTNAYILNSSVLTANNNFSIIADAVTNLTSTVDAYTAGGVVIGASMAESIVGGQTKIDLGENITISSNDLTIKTNTNDKVKSDSNATSGALLGGTGASSTARITKNSGINILKNINLLALGNILLKSEVKNDANAISDGRAYGGVTVGGSGSFAEINNTSGIEIADATETDKKLSGKSLTIDSTVENNTNGSTKAGSGAIVGISGSGVRNNITSNNIVKVGRNTIETTNGDYILNARTDNTYKGYNDSSAYGVVGVSAGIIENTINSTVNAISNADIEAHGAIDINAINTTKKSAVSNYDMYGGAGGVVGVGSASLKDNIVMNTYTGFGGNKANATGTFDKGFITVASNTDVDINEKVDVDAGGAIPVADGISKVTVTSNTKTEISNKDVDTLDDDIYYLANSNTNIYTKANVESYGGIAVADGESSAINSSNNVDVVINSGVNSLSGRDTYIQATANKNIQAYMYAETDGFIGAVGGSVANAKNNSSHSYINIAANSYLGAMDSMNLIALDSTQSVRAYRSAKGTTRALFGIPISVEGEGHEYTADNSSSIISLNGHVESGKGANKSLVINKEGTYETDGINVIGREEVGKITSADLNSDKELLETQKANAIKEVDDYIKVQNDNIENAQESYNKAENDNIVLNTENQTYSDALDAASTLKDNNNEINNLDTQISKIKALQESLGEYELVDTPTEPTPVFPDMTSFEENCELCKEYSELADVISAYEKFKNEETVEKFQALSDAVDALDNVISNKQNTIDSIKTENNDYISKITAINNNVDCSNNTQLDTFVSDVNGRIETNNTTISNNNTIMETAQTNIDDANQRIESANAEKTNIETKFNSEIDEIDKRLATTQDGEISISSLKIDDVEIRSGETNISGNVIGSGKITTPGNKFSINIENNSVSDIVYGNLKIGNNVKGGIYGSAIPNSITKEVLSNENSYLISVLNTADANDPAINLANGAGDMVFYGDLENVNGTISLINYTGNILSDGAVTTKNLKIAAPNGGVTQNYSTNTYKTGGIDGTGAIIASGDIDIASKIIDINGLIQSGSEIKAVTIPDLKIVKEGETYYQIVNGIKTALKPGMTEGYYYLNLDGNGQLDSELELVKAYFKPTDSTDLNDIKGDIHLFKAEIEGGNITLTGNIQSTTNTGKIVLINGYGHIDIVNNSKYDIVTSALNADSKIQSKLTINDFIFSSTDKSGSNFDNITEDNLNDKNWLSQHANIFTVEVGDNGFNEDGIILSTTGLSYIGSDGSFSILDKTTRGDGARIYSTSYIPGNDAYYVAKAGYEVTDYYDKYVPRSWWTEFWCGKEYVRVYYSIYKNPEYGIANKPISIAFQGFDTPQINVTSNNSSIIIDKNISALAGDVNLISNKDIMTNSINNLISATNIDLKANGNIGSSETNSSGINLIKPIQNAVYNNGILTAKGNNVYLNYPISDVSNINVTAQNDAYIATSGNTLGNSSGTVEITAKGLELSATNGSINLDYSDDTVNVEKIKARAAGDISIMNDGDLNITSVVSENKGIISLGSKTGSLNTTETEIYSPYHIMGGNVILNAVNGHIATKENPFLIANDGIFNVVAKDDINLSSIGRIYVDLIKSTSGSINLNADYGIIASQSSDNLPYNIFTPVNINLNSDYGNIENIMVNTNGIINATAGYKNGIVSGMSDISLTLVTNNDLLKEDFSSLTEAQYNNLMANSKDMKIGTIKAAKNVVLKSERSVLNADNNSSITGESILISAINGDVGTDSSHIALNANRDVTIFAGNGKNVYLTSVGENALNINQIRSAIHKDTTEVSNDVQSLLNNVVIDVNGNINNASKNNGSANIIAKNILLNAQNNIGSLINYFAIETPTEDSLLSYTAQNAYIKGVGDTLYANPVSVTNDNYLSSADGTNIKLASLTLGSDLVINSGANTILDTVTANNNLDITSKNKTVISDTKVINNFTNHSNDFEVTNKLTVENDAEITASGKTTIANATVKGDFANTSKDFEITNKLTVGNDAVINATNSVVIADMQTKALSIDSTTVGITNMTVDTDAEITASGKTTIANADVKGNFTNTSKDFEITDKLTVVNDAIINATDSVVIADMQTKALSIDSTTVGITDMTVDTDAEITATGKTTIANADVKGNFTNDSKDFEVTDKLTVGNNAKITATGKTTIANADVKGNFTNDSKDFEVTDKLTVVNNAIINATDSVVIADMQTKALSIDSTTVGITNMTVDTDAEITATGKTTIANAYIKGNLAISSSDVDIDEINLEGNIKAQADDININTSNNLNIDKIAGKNSEHAENVFIKSLKSILNGKTDDTTNVIAKNLNFEAQDTIGQADKKLNIEVVNNNNLSMKGDNGIYTNLSGENVNYDTLVSKNIDMNINGKLNVNKMDVNNGVIKVNSQNVDIKNIENINDVAIYTSDKYVKLSNSFKPAMDADLQLYLNDTSGYLTINGNNILTHDKYVIHHNAGVIVNEHTDNNNNMLDEINTSSVATIDKNILVSNNTIKNADKKLNVLRTVNNYVIDVINGYVDNNLVKSIKGNKIENSDIDDFINLTMNIDKDSNL